jgi:hypothetical protein
VLADLKNGDQFFDQMGLDLGLAEFLYSRARRGISLGRVLVLGRLTVYMTPYEVQKVKAWTGVSLQPTGFADAFFPALGATTVSVLDYSDYEGADILHDLNEPLAPKYHARFDTVIDGGTLEHVFNFPVALRTCMEAVGEGGRFIISTPANGQMGHGFYQFTPELFYRAFSPNSGFEVEQLLLRHAGLWYETTDPAAVHSRVEAATSRAASIFVSARRLHLVPVFEPWPIQSDYALQYALQTSERKPYESRGIQSLKDRLVTQYPVLAELQARWRFFKGVRYARLSNPKLFRKIGAALP